MIMQGRSQSQSLLSIGQFSASSDQVGLPIGALGGNPTKPTDCDIYSGSETSTANTLFNTAVQQQSSRGADFFGTESRQLSV